jgi:hypothetical protein
MFNLQDFIDGKKAHVNKTGMLFDVKYEAILCSLTNIISGENHYYLVDKDGSAINIITYLGLEKAQFLLSTESPKKEEKPDVVTVIRHVRGFNYDTTEIAAKGGATLICDINYKNNIIKVYPSICSEKDNFDKKIGIHYAEKSKENQIYICCELKPLTEINPLLNVIQNAIISGNYFWSNMEHSRYLDKPLRRIFNGL